MPLDVPISTRRVGAALLVVLVVPVLVTIATLNEDSPLAEGQIATRTVRVGEVSAPIRVEDPEATELERRQARGDVVPPTTTDQDQIEATLDALDEVFRAVRDARAPVQEQVTVQPSPPEPPPGRSPGSPPSPTVTTSEREPTDAEARAAIDASLPFLAEEAQQRLVDLSPTQLDSVQDDFEQVVTRLLSAGGITGDELPAGDGLPSDEFAAELESVVGIVPWPQPRTTFADEVVTPILLEQVLRQTTFVDDELYQEQLAAAEEAVDEVERTWGAGEVVVEVGEEISAVQFAALERLGEAGSPPGVAFVRALLAMGVVVALLGFYFKRSQPELWADPPRLLVLAATVVVAALLLVLVELLVGPFGDAAWFAFPVGGLVLLIAVLTSPAVGLVAALPLAVMALLFAPAVPSLAILVTAVVVLAAPMIEHVSTRVGLRRASVRVAVASPALAVAAAVVFGPRENLLDVAIAAAIAAVANVGLLQGLLPAFENAFRLPTVTALLDLADRNHPLLRELETKAMGSYNHSVMVASLAERCCREIGANHLLAQVAGLYHDIGKVRQPLFFIENQRGIANPHDQLTPRMSAVIIQNHVVDGVELATQHRLPPDVVDCIASHHGTMKVTYFYKLAVDAKGGDASQVDESHFRYKGHTPRSKEAGVLLLADCTEAATRAMAMDRGTLPTDLIESTVDRLVSERVEDGQFADCALTFTEFQTVRDTLVEALTGIYHPRIGYPPQSDSSGSS